jgi:hypothetical protein
MVWTAGRAFATKKKLKSHFFGGVPKPKPKARGAKGDAKAKPK